MPTRSEALPYGTIVFTNKKHKIGSDSLLLASFCPIRPQWAACDLGAGCGILALSLIDRGLQGQVVVIEQESSAAALLAEAKTTNLLSSFEVITQDFCSYKPPHLFDLVVSNPPYFQAGPLPQDPARAAARHEMVSTLAELCATAARLLKEGGRFSLCFPPTRLAELFFSLSAEHLSPKRLQLVRKTPETEPWLALVEARKQGGVGLSILPDRLLPSGTPLCY